jgi:hypothetical protein
MIKNVFFLKGLSIGIGIGILLPLLKMYIEFGVFDYIGVIIALICILLGWFSEAKEK